jgi:hypothetical protein
VGPEPCILPSSPHSRAGRSVVVVVVRYLRFRGGRKETGNPQRLTCAIRIRTHSACWFFILLRSQTSAAHRFPGKQLWVWGCGF